MKAIKVGRLRAVIAAIALAAAALVYIDAHSSPAGAAAEMSSELRSSDAGEVELATLRTDLVSKLEAALGQAFGGVWFDPPTARLHVGVTSPASRRSAEAVAVQVGMEGDVTPTLVRSTWAQLEAAQERLNRHLDDLFARGETRTSLAPDRNSVEIMLGAAVPIPRRSELMREVAALGVDVSVDSISARRILARPKGRCNKHKEKEAYCDKPIVAGVRIESKNGEECTAGPAAINKDRTTSAKATETFLLTAGHCINNGGGKGAEWFAFNKKGEKKLIGKSVDYLHSVAVKFDVGVIKLDNPGEWVNAGNIPVLPTIAPWNEATPEPFAVTAQGKKPIKGFKVCFSGQVKGTACAEVNEPSVTEKFNTGTTVEKLVELKSAPTGFGDSGSPWFSEATPGEVYGTLVGETGGGKDVFQLLEVSFERLKAKKALDLELLIAANQERHPKIQSEGSGATPTLLTGEQQSTETFKANAGTMHCQGVTYSGELTETESTEVNVIPDYSECTLTVSGGESLTATVDENGCSYLLTVSGEVHLECPGAAKLQVTAPLCTVTVPPQTVEGVEYEDLGSGTTREIDLVWSIAAMEYTQTAFCPGGGGTFTNGTYEGAARVTGEDAEGAHVGIWRE